MDFGTLLRSLLGVPPQSGSPSPGEAPAFQPGTQFTLGNPGPATPLNTPPAPTPGLGSALSGLFPVQASPQAPQGPQGTSDSGEAVVEHNPVFHSQVHGHNLLGILGDAFLAQAGRPLQYAPRVQQAREAEALQNLTSNPDQAIHRLASVNAPVALQLYNSHSDDARQQAIADAQVRAAGDVHQQIGYARLGSILSTANPQNYSRVRDIANTVAQQYGIDMPVDLPQTYDEKALDNARNAFVPVPTQEQQDARDFYRQQMMTYRRDSMASREQIAAANRGAANTRAAGAQAGATARTNITTNAANGRAARGLAETARGNNLRYKAAGARQQRRNLVPQFDAAGNLVGVTAH